MDKENASHVFVLTNLHGLCELAKTELFKRKIARTTITKTKDERYFFESVAIHDWNCDPKSNPNNAANADNVHEFMIILKQQEYYEYIRKKFNSDIGGSEVVEILCSPDAHTLGIEPNKLIPVLNEGHILSSDELTALGIVQCELPYTTNVCGFGGIMKNDTEKLEKSSCYYINGELSISVVDDDKIYLIKYDGEKEKYFELPKTKELLKFLEIEE